MKTIWQDLRYALRLHLKNPKLAIIIIATLGLGIGCVTAVFTVVNSVVLRPLPYYEPGSLIRIYESNPAQDVLYFSVSPLNWMDWRKQNHSFEDLGAFARQQDFNLTNANEPQQISGTRISGNLLSVLGAKPMKGDVFSSEHDKAGTEDVAILSYRLWNANFGKDQQVIGKKIYLDQKPYRIVGVMGQDFQLPFNDGEIYLPLSIEPKKFNDRSNHFLRVIGRLKPGVTYDQALLDVKNVAAGLEAQYRDSNKDWSVTMQNLEFVVVPEPFQKASWIIFGASFLVLMISCLNVANLLTAKAIGRHREISIRKAMGATTSRLFSQLLTESCLIAVISSVVGILLAVWAVELLHALKPVNIPRLNEIHIDPLAMMVAIVVASLTVVFFGTYSLFQSLKQDLQEGLKEGTLAATTGAFRTRVRNILVIIEAAFSLVLLICAALLLKSFFRLQSVDLGYNPNSVIALKVTAPVDKDPELQKLGAIHRLLVERVRAIPGIKYAAISNLVPMTLGNSMTDFSKNGPPSPSLGNVYASSFRIVSPDYFKAMNIQLLRGEYFSETHLGKSVIIDEFLLNRYWKDQDPIGQKIYIAGFDGPFEIIGIARKVKTHAIDEEPWPIFYLSSLEVPPEPSVYMVAQTSGNPGNYAQTLRKTIRAVDPHLVIGKASPVHQIISDSLSQRRFNIVILALFAGVALILASVGLYSVISYSVSQRNHEIGIRMALGARQHDVVKMVVKEGLLLAVIGITIGIFLSMASTRMLSTLLYFVSPTDLMIFQLCSLFFLALGFLSSYIPARRAASVDPIFALRHE
jgi:putative ABC transport system permease protein